MKAVVVPRMGAYSAIICRAANRVLEREGIPLRIQEAP